MRNGNGNPLRRRSRRSSKTDRSTMHSFKCLFVRDRERWPRGKIFGNAVALAVAFELQLHSKIRYVRFFPCHFAVRAHPDLSHHRRLDVRHPQLEQLGGALHGTRIHPAGVPKVIDGVAEGGAPDAAGRQNSYENITRRTYIVI